MSFDYSSLMRPSPAFEAQLQIASSLSASSAFEAVKKYVQSFDASLDSEHETGAKLTSFGQSVIMNVSCIRCEDPNVLVFEGLVDGKQATLVQHVSQLNFLLVSIPRKDSSKPKMPIGFAG